MSTVLYISLVQKDDSTPHGCFLSLLRQVRQDAGLTQAKLAGLLGKPQSFVSKYESGERRLDVLELREICVAAGISLESFASRLEGSLDSAMAMGRHPGIDNRR